MASIWLKLTFPNLKPRISDLIHSTLVALKNHQHLAIAHHCHCVTVSRKEPVLFVDRLIFERKAEARPTELLHPKSPATEVTSPAQENTSPSQRNSERGVDETQGGLDDEFISHRISLKVSSLLTEETLAVENILSIIYHIIISYPIIPYIIQTFFLK